MGLRAETGSGEGGEGSSSDLLQPRTSASHTTLGDLVIACCIAMLLPGEDDPGDGRKAGRHHEPVKR